MISVITNIYNKKTKGPTVMEVFTATGKLKKFFLQLETFDVCTTSDTAHIDTIFRFLPHTRQHGCINILHCCSGSDLRGYMAIVGRTVYVPRDLVDLKARIIVAVKNVNACVARTWISYRCVPCHPWWTHRTSLVVKKTFSIFLWLWTIPLR
jgi:hypothetical protein